MSDSDTSGCFMLFAVGLFIGFLEIFSKLDQIIQLLRELTQ